MKFSKNADLNALLAALRITDQVPIAAFAVVAEVLFAVLEASPAPAGERERTP
jgi:hypothetical protein